MNVFLNKACLQFTSEFICIFTWIFMSIFFNCYEDFKKRNGNISCEKSYEFLSKKFLIKNIFKEA